ncbi:hypothetical protein WN943_005913 [Citrus x changshan-huyou]
MAIKLLKNYSSMLLGRAEQNRVRVGFGSTPSGFGLGKGLLTLHFHASLSQISSPSSFKAQTQSFQNSIRQPKFGSLLAGLMELESDRVMVEEWRLGGGATNSVLCSSRSVDRNQIKILAEARWLLRGGRLQLASEDVASDGLCDCWWWVPSCRRQAVWLSVVGSKLQEREAVACGWMTHRSTVGCSLLLECMCSCAICNG